MELNDKLLFVEEGKKIATEYHCLYLGKQRKMSNKIYYHCDVIRTHSYDKINNKTIFNSDKSRKMWLSEIFLRG